MNNRLKSLFADLTYIAVTFQVMALSVALTVWLNSHPYGVAGWLALLCARINPTNFWAGYRVLNVIAVVFAQTLTVTVIAATRPWLFARAAWGWYDPRTDGESPQAWLEAWDEHLQKKGL